MSNIETQHQEQIIDTRDEYENVYAYMVNGPRKLFENSVKTLKKPEAIKMLNECRYTTPAWAVAGLLSVLLDNEDTIENNWLFIATHYTPKTINSVIREMIKQHQWGTPIKNSAGFFTSVIKKKVNVKNIENKNE